MKISVITLTKNNCTTLERAMVSLIDQTYKNYEHIIVDAHSNDCTLDILDKYQKYISVVLHDKGEGIYSALNLGIQAASGDIIGILHADDFFANKSILERIAGLFKQGADIVYGDVIYVLPNGRLWRYWKAGDFKKSKLSYGWMPPHTSVFVKKKLFERYGYYREDMRIASDYDMILRFFSKKLQIKYLPEIIVVMTVGGESNRNLKNILTKMKEDRRVAIDNGYNGLKVVLFKNLRKIRQISNLGIVKNGKSKLL